MKGAFLSFLELFKNVFNPAIISVAISYINKIKLKRLTAAKKNINKNIFSVDKLKLKSY